VVWDYHVILLLRPREPHLKGSGSLPAVKTSHKSSSWVYDFDTTLPVPCQWEGDSNLTVDIPDLTVDIVRIPVDDFPRGPFTRLRKVNFSLLLRASSTIFRLTKSSKFRVVAGLLFLKHFASDRSHMVSRVVK